MKRTLSHLILAVSFYIVLYPVFWITVSQMSFGEAEFGYYREFYVAQHAFQKSDCVEKIEYNYVNKDVELEEFTFQITTKSGRIVRFFFDASNMDVNQVCYAPRGLSVLHTAHEQARLYSMEGLCELLKEKGIQIKDLNDILCHLDELEPLFRTQNGDATFRLQSDRYVWDCLRIRFPNEAWTDIDHFLDIKEHTVQDSR